MGDCCLTYADSAEYTLYLILLGLAALAWITITVYIMVKQDWMMWGYYEQDEEGRLVRRRKP